MSRRDVLRVAGAMGFTAGISAVLAACGAAATASPSTASASPSAGPASPSAAPGSPSAGAASPSTAASPSVSSVVAAVGTGLDEGPYYVGLSKGWYDEVGLKVKATDPPSGIEALNQVVSGQAFCGSLGSVVLFNAVAQKLPVVMVSLDHGWNQDHYGSVTIVASKASGIKAGDIAGLKGKKVGTRTGTDNEGGLAAYLKSVGLTKKDVQIVAVPPPQGAVALQTGQVDAVAHIEPFASQSLVLVQDSVLVTPDYAPTYMPGCLTIAKDFLSKHRDVVLAFVGAHDRGMQFARQDPAQMIQINQSYIPSLPLGAAYQALKKLRFDPRMSKATWRRFQEETIPGYVEAGLMPQVDAAAFVNDLVDPSVSQEVQKAHPDYYSDLPPIPAADQL